MGTERRTFCFFEVTEEIFTEEEKIIMCRLKQKQNNKHV